jgi:hypothetical protein
LPMPRRTMTHPPFQSSPRMAPPRCACATARKAAVSSVHIMWCAPGAAHASTRPQGLDHLTRYGTRQMAHSQS